MCLAVPMKIIQKSGDTGIVETGGITYKVNFSLLPDVEPEDYVIVHTGFAIQKLDIEEAEERLKLFQSMKKDSEANGKIR